MGPQHIKTYFYMFEHQEIVEKIKQINHTCMAMEEMEISPLSSWWFCGTGL